MTGRLVVVKSRHDCPHRADTGWETVGPPGRMVYCQHPERRRKRDNDCDDGGGFPKECPLPKAEPKRSKK